MKRVILIAGLLIPLLVVGTVAWRRVHAVENALIEVRVQIGTRQATAQLDQLSRDHPRNPEVQFLSARQARSASKLRQASAALDRAEQLGWPLAEIERERTLLLAVTDFRQARPALDRLLVDHPQDADTLLALAEGETQVGHTELAAEYASRVLDRNADDVRAHAIRGKAWLQARRLDLARTDLEVVLTHPDSVVFDATRLTLATCLLDLGDFAAAYEHFHAAQVDDPDNLFAVFGVGRASAYLRRFDEAEVAFAKVLNLRPGHVETLLSLAQVVEQRGDLSGALKLLEQAERGEPTRAETHSRLAKLLAALGRDDQATAHEIRYRQIEADRVKNTKLKTESSP